MAKEITAKSNRLAAPRHLGGLLVSIPEDLKAGMIKGIASGSLSPVFIASAFNNVGVDAFLAMVANNFPSPADMPPVKAKKGEAEVAVPANPAGPLLAQVFKTTSDPGIGDVFFFRVWKHSH